MGKFSRSEVRKILGDACTPEIENALLDLHRGVLDPLLDDLEKVKADAEKLPGVQKKLDDLEASTVPKADYDNIKKEFDEYKADVTGKETLGKKQAAYRKLLDAKKINAADADLIMAGTKFDGMKLKDDGTLDGEDGLTKDIETRFARYIPTEGTKGANVDNPPAGNNGTGANPRAAQLEKRYFEQRYGKAPANDGANDNK